MKKVIEGKLYNTQTAKEVTFWQNEYLANDIYYHCITLFKKKSGEYFLEHTGGAGTEYCGGEIIPLSTEDAMKFVLNHADDETFHAEFGVDTKYEDDLTSESHDYKGKKDYIGASDIAELTLCCNGEKTPLYFGEDGTYHAYIVHGTCDIPLHYAKVAQFKDKIDIIDDDGFVTCYEANVIRVYRAGEFGCIIQLLDNNKQ